MPKAADLTPAFDAVNYSAVIGFDFSPWLPSGVTVTGGTVTCTQYASLPVEPNESAAIDSAPSSRLTGAPSIGASTGVGGTGAANTQVNQQISNLVDQVVYQFLCEATFSDGLPREPIWTHMAAEIPD